MTFNQLTLNHSNLVFTLVSNGSTITVTDANKQDAIDNDPSSTCSVVVNQASIYITYTFSEKQFLGKISLHEAAQNVRDFDIEVSTNGTDYTTVQSITDRVQNTPSEYQLSRNYIKYQSFRLKISTRC